MLERAADRQAQGTGRAARLRPRPVLVLAMLTLLQAQAAPVSAQVPSPNPGDIGRAPETVVPGDPRTSTAPTWEYRTLFVTWDRDLLDWVADFSDGTRIQGLDAILNNEGRNGWELVMAMPEQWSEIVDAAILQEVRRMRIFLKKPLD